MITVDETKLIELEISVQDFIFCYYLNLKEKPGCLLDAGYPLEYDLQKLEEKGLIQRIGDNIFITKTFKKLIDINYNQCFEEFWNTFPSSTDDGRKLKTANRSVIKKKYEDIVKEDQILHDLIIACLKEEINQRKSEGLKFMRHIATWINNRTWEAYVDDVANKRKSYSEEELKPENRLYE